MVMRVTIEIDGAECSVSLPDAVGIDELYNLVKQAMLGVGYAPETVDEYMADEV